MAEEEEEEEEEEGERVAEYGAAWGLDRRTRRVSTPPAAT